MIVNDSLLFYKALWFLNVIKLYIKALNLNFYAVIIYSSH